MSRRAAAALAAASLTLGGMIISYVVPIFSATGLRYTTVAEIRSGLLAGLLVSLLGTSLAMSLTQPRKKDRCRTP